MACYIWVAALLSVITTGNGQNLAGCSWRSFTSNRIYNFSSLVLKGSEYSIPGSRNSDRQYIFYFNFCGGVKAKPASPSIPTTGCSPTDAVCQYDPAGDGIYYSAGKLASAKWSENPHGVTVTYSGGSSAWEPKDREVIVQFRCAEDTVFGPAFYDSDLDKATAYINISAPEACGRVVSPAATCQEISYEDSQARDGEYTIRCPEASLTLPVWCHDMSSGSAQEFLTLPSVSTDNYASYLCGPRCRQRHPMGSTVRTTYRKIRVNPCTLTVDIQDRTFATSIGSVSHGTTNITTMPFGVAGSCENTGAREYPGTAAISLIGLPLKVKSSWVPMGENSYGKAVLSADGKRVAIDGGGFCGQYAPSGFQMYAPPNQSQFVLELEEAPLIPPAPIATWTVASPGMSCSDYCTKAVGKSCIEGHWPTTLQEFKQIGEPVASCTSITAGNYPTNPQRSSNAGPGVCYWEAFEQSRCALRPEPSHVRFCPCGGDLEVSPTTADMTPIDGPVIEQ